MKYPLSSACIAGVVFAGSASARASPFCGKAGASDWAEIAEALVGNGGSSTSRAMRGWAHGNSWTIDGMTMRQRLVFAETGGANRIVSRKVLRRSRPRVPPSIHGAA